MGIHTKNGPASDDYNIQHYRDYKKLYVEQQKTRYYIFL